MKYCKDCKWFWDINRTLDVVCQSPRRPIGHSPVYGPRVTESNPHRLRDADIWCGPDAKWFESKEAK